MLCEPVLVGAQRPHHRVAHAAGPHTPAPGLGNVADIFWKANSWNMALLERHARPGVPHTRFDAWFVWGIGLTLLAAAALPVVLAVWMAAVLYAWLV